jgi:hypothetical protein
VAAERRGFAKHCSSGRSRRGGQAVAVTEAAKEVVTASGVPAAVEKGNAAFFDPTTVNFDRQRATEKRAVFWRNISDQVSCPRWVIRRLQEGWAPKLRDAEIFRQTENDWQRRAAENEDQRNEPVLRFLSDCLAAATRPR